MFGIRKRDGHQFPCSSKTVCRIEDNSTNSYLIHDRAIEDFLREIEPNYNESVATLQSGKVNRECISAIAGFISYVATCSPAGMRIQSEPLKRSIEATTMLLDAQGKLSHAPESLGPASMTELLTNGTITVEVDPKYPQAMGIAGIRDFVTRFGNMYWEVLINDDPNNSRFFTSDFPIAIERTRDPRLHNRIVPLTPSLAVRIIPDLQSVRATDISFSSFRSARRRPNQNEIREINTAVVRCAEQLVFYRDHHDWVPRFVTKHSKFRIEGKTQRIEIGDSQLLLATQVITNLSK